MSAVTVPSPNFAQPFVDADGMLTTWGRRFLTDLFNRSGGTVDKVDAAYAAAGAATPGETEIVPVAPIVGGGKLDGNVLVQFGLGSFLVAQLPTVSLGAWAYCIDGRKAAEGAGLGTGTWVWSDGNAWLNVDSGIAVAA